MLSPEILGLGSYCDSALVHYQVPVDVSPLYAAARGECDFEPGPIIPIPEIRLMDEMADFYAGLKFGEADTNMLHELDLVERAANIYDDERDACRAVVAAADRAITQLAYRGSRMDHGIPGYAAMCERGIRDCGRLIWPASMAVNNALSGLRLFGRPVTVTTPEGAVLTGKVKSWGRMARFGEPGLGLVALVKDGDNWVEQVVDIGLDDFELAS